MAEHTQQWAGIDDSSRKTVGQFLQNPHLYSEQLCRRTLERSNAQGFDVHDVQEIIRTHMKVIAESLRGEPQASTR